MDLNQYRGINTGKIEATSNANTYVNQTDVDWSLKHFFTLLVGGGVFGVVASYCLSLFNSEPHLGSMLTAIISLCALLVVLIFQSLLLKSVQLFIWVTLVEVAGLISFFLSELNPWLIFGALAFAGYAITGFLKGRLDLTDHLRVNFGRFTKIVLSFSIGGLAIFLAFFYVGAYRTQGITFNAFRFISAGSVPILRQFVPQYDSAMSADDFFKEFARKQLASNPQFVLLLTSDQETVVAQTGYQLRGQIAQVTKTLSQAGETFEHYLYRIANYYLSFVSGNRLLIIPTLLILFTLYGVIRALMFFFKWPVVLVSYIIYRLLISLRLVYITTEPRSKEIIMVK